MERWPPIIIRLTWFAEKSLEILLFEKFYSYFLDCVCVGGEDDRSLQASCSLRGLFGWVFGLIAKRWGNTYAYLVAPFIWVFTEYIRSHFFFLVVWLHQTLQIGEIELTVPIERSTSTFGRKDSMPLRISLLIFVVAGFVLLFVALVLLRTRTEIHKRRARALLARERMA